MICAVTRTGSAVEDERSGMVLSVIKAFGLLETLAAAPEGMTLSDLSRRSAMHPSTAHRLLHTLIHLGYARQDARTKCYHLGLGALHIGRVALSQNDAEGMALPALRQLAERTGETVSLVVRDGIEVTCVAQAVSPNATHVTTTIGSRSPLHCTSGGKVLLAALPEDEQERLIARLPLERCTDNTIIHLGDLQVELRRVRQRGYAFDDEELQLGVRSVAAAVRDRARRAVSAVCISGPSSRISGPRLADLSRLVQQAAGQVSNDLGYRPEQ